VGLAVIFLFRLGKDLIVVEKAKLSKTMLSDLILLIIVIDVFLILGYYGNGTAASFRFQAGLSLYFSFLLI
jgi:hypothetical protein